MNQSEIAYIKLKRLKARVYRIVFENASISVGIIYLIDDCYDRASELRSFRSSSEWRFQIYCLLDWVSPRWTMAKTDEQVD